VGRGSERHYSGVGSRKQYLQFRRLSEKNFFHTYGMDPIEEYASNNSSIVAFVTVTASQFLPSRCLAPLRGYTYRHKD
jgi:hypothetical protein